MDDTTQSRTSDVASNAATRKRRSSILKSQRPRRTPFCELEFNACTPSDTSKSRRVSFSKRTGVAEFATNEATTTWKNFYEEHNKSLESSGHDAEMHGKQPIAHLGKQVFDQQFEEMEAVDFMGTLNPGINISSSLNNINFTQLECTDVKLTAPHANFEMSSLTETQSKLFRDDLGMTRTGEVSGQIDMNFSTTQQIAERDDLDEIQKDLQRHTDIVCQGPFTGHNLSEYIEVDLNMTHVTMNNDECNMSITDTIQLPKVQDVSKSCSIEKKINISDKDWVTDKENIVLNPYVAPRESINFAIPESQDEVLVFDGKRLFVETEKPQKENYRQSVIPKISERVPQRKTIVLNCNDDLPNFLEEAQVSKNQSSLVGFSDIQQNRIFEDIPAHYKDDIRDKRDTIVFDDGLDISETRPIPNVITNVEKRQTIVYDDEIGNISMTQVLPSNIVDNDKKRSIVYGNESANISITQAVSANVIIHNEKEKRKTIVFENDACNISMTQAIPTNIIPESIAMKRRTIANVLLSQALNEKEKQTIVNEDNIGRIPFTHTLTSSTNENVQASERKATNLLESEFDNISFEQSLLSNIILPQKPNTTIYGSDANISMTQALPRNILLGHTIESNRRNTVVYEDDTGNLSITQAVSKNQVIQSLANHQHVIEEPITLNRRSQVSFHNESAAIDRNSEDVSNTRDPSINQVHKQENNSIPSEEIIGNKRRTIVFQNDDAEISMTQAVPVRQVIENIVAQHQKNIYANKEAINEALDKDKDSTNKRTVIFENDDADISLTQAISINRVIDTVKEDKENEKYSNPTTKEVPSTGKKSINQVMNIIKENTDIETIKSDSNKEELTNRRTTKVFENEDADISMTQAVPMNKVIDIVQKENHNFEAVNAASRKEETNKRRTVVFENEEADISMTQAVPMNQVFNAIQKENVIIEATVLKEESKGKRKTVVFNNDEADISMTQAVPLNQIIDSLLKDTVRYSNITATNATLRKEESTNKNKNDEADISVTQAVPKNIDTDIITKENQTMEVVNTEDEELSNKRRTLVEKEDIDKSISESVSQILHGQKDESKHIIPTNEFGMVRNETYDNATNNRKTCIVYDDDEGDKDTIRAISSSSTIIMPDEVKITTIPIDSKDLLLENEDLFMEIDRLTDGGNVSKAKFSYEEDSDMSMPNFRDTEISGKKSINLVRNDANISKANRKKISPKNLSKSRLLKTRHSFHKKQSVSFSKPSSLCKDIARHNSTLPNAFSDVLIYQSLTSNLQNVVKTEISNCEVTSEEDKVANEENRDSSLSSFINLSCDVKLSEHDQSDIQHEYKNVVTEATSKVSAEKNDNTKKNDSILNDLLDMSQMSFEGTDSKDLLAQTSCVQVVPASIEVDTNIAPEPMFYISKDSDDDRSTKSDTASKTQEAGQIGSQMPLGIEYKDDDDTSIERDVQSKLSTIKNVIREMDVSQFKPDRSKLDEDAGSKVSLDMSRRKSAKSFKMANDTNELLDMLSDFTDNGPSRNLPTEKRKEVIPELPELENKVESKRPELSRQSVLKRQSKIISREDLLNNLSMASAVLQKSRSDFGEYVDMEEVRDTPNVSKDNKRSVKLSTDVVKMLQFNDDSVSEKSISIQTPLKKTAFGEISYMKETKSKVIPGFLDNLSDGVKELMDDLVKPIFNAEPFQELANTNPEKKLKQKPSTCSNQIQANLLTSSQIDIHTDLYSTTDSVCNVAKLSSVDIITDAVNRSVSRALKSPEQSTPTIGHSGKSSEFDATSVDTESRYARMSASKPVTSSRPLGNVLIFDQHNPLNNVLLASTPPHAVDIHKYDPIKLAEESEPPPYVNVETQHEEGKITSQYLVELLTSMKSHQHSPKSNTQSVTSNTVEPIPIDQFTEPRNNNIRDKEINTVIAMKGNEELLEANSSLTLVDDEVTRKNDYSRIQLYNRNTASSPVKVIYVVEESPKKEMESDFTSTDEVEKLSKTSKRAYSPTKKDTHKHCTFSSLDITPKPVSKMQRRSLNSNYGELNELAAERDESTDPIAAKKSPTQQKSPPQQKSLPQEKSPPRQKSPRRNRSKKPGTTVTVQQMMTMVHVESNHTQPAQEWTDSSTTEPRSVGGSREFLASATSSDVISSFASSNNLRCEPSIGRSSVSGNPSKVGWLPMTPSFSTAGSMTSHDDIVGAIDAMPFMGSPDCQWECVAGSEWNILLLHARLRLTVRFEETERVRADTRLTKLELETLHEDKKNPIAHLCVVYAAALMRHHMSRGCGAGADVGKLVRRLCGAARLAAQWARAMHDARARLAYSLGGDGRLALKVANTSYRAVWEVSLRLELVVQAPHAAPWPAARCVRVSRVLSAAAGAPLPDVAPALASIPSDWGHAPRTIWKVFHYLKHKKRDDVPILHL